MVISNFGGEIVSDGAVMSDYLMTETRDEVLISNFGDEIVSVEAIIANYFIGQVRDKLVITRFMDEITCDKVSFSFFIKFYFPTPISLLKGNIYSRGRKNTYRRMDG